MTNNTVWLQLLGLSIILIMYMHQALPKELPTGKRPAYQITKKFSPKQRQPFSHLV
jgi:hypothetical protein